MSTAIIPAVSNAVVKAAAKQAIGSAVAKAAKAATKTAVAAATTKITQAALRPWPKGRSTTIRRNGRRPNVRSQANNLNTTVARAYNQPSSRTMNFQSQAKPLRVRQWEIVGPVATSKSYKDGAFEATEYGLNPADTTTFPWLSSVARQYDKFKINSLTFTYVNYASTTVAGTVALAVDYDVYNPKATNIMQLGQKAKFATCAPYSSMNFTIPARHPGNRTWLYVFDEIDVKSKYYDAKTYNLGKLTVAVEGLQSANQKVGYLVVSYDITFMDKTNLPPARKIDDKPVQGTTSSFPSSAADGGFSLNSFGVNTYQLKSSELEEGSRYSTEAQFSAIFSGDPGNLSVLYTGNGDEVVETYQQPQQVNNWTGIYYISVTDSVYEDTGIIQIVWPNQATLNDYVITTTCTPLA